MSGEKPRWHNLREKRRKSRRLANGEGKNHNCWPRPASQYLVRGYLYLRRMSRW